MYMHIYYTLLRAHTPLNDYIRTQDDCRDDSKNCKYFPQKSGPDETSNAYKKMYSCLYDQGGEQDFFAVTTLCLTNKMFNV